jgi:hypothetical protein
MVGIFEFGVIIGLPYQNGYKFWSPKPANCEVEYVAESMNEEHNGWNMQLVNDMFLPFEAQQIAQIPVVYNQKDEFVWWANKNGEFSVKLAYHFLKQRKDSVHLMWHTLHNRILVRMALFYRGVHCSPICCLCDKHNETAEHLRSPICIVIG